MSRRKKAPGAAATTPGQFESGERFDARIAHAATKRDKSRRYVNRGGRGLGRR